MQYYTSDILIRMKQINSFLKYRKTLLKYIEKNGKKQ